MAVLSDQQIWDLLDAGDLVITPRPESDAVSPSTIDLRLGQKFTKPRSTGGAAVEQHIDTRDSEAVMEAISELSEVVQIDEGGFITIEPGQFMLAQTWEHIELPSTIAARIEGRSTMARLGLSVHQTAPIVHPTYRGVLTLEMHNIGPYTLKLYPGQTICQLLLEEMSQGAAGELRSVHQDTPSA